LTELQAVFLDRDGTIGGTGHFVHPRDFTLYEGAQQAIDDLKRAGLKVFAFTNQHRISRNEATVEEFRSQFKQYGFDESFICPHGDGEECTCRKPQPGMLLEAAQKYGLDLSRCVVIGDVGSTDMLAANAVGALKILVRTGWGEDTLTTYRDRWSHVEPNYIAEDIVDATNWILSGMPGSQPEVVQLSLDHLNDCTSLFVEVFNSEPWNDEWTEETATRRMSMIFANQGFVGVGHYSEDRLNGIVVGYREQWFDGEHFNIIEFCVRSDQQGKGIGTKILLQLERTLAQLRVKKIYLLTMRDSLAESFYKKNGYYVSGKMMMMGKRL